MATELRWGRRLLVLVLLVLAAWAVLSDASVLTACKDVASKDETGSTNICEPVGLASPLVLGYLLILGLLVFPDLSELDIAGVLTLKARTEVAEAKADDAKADAQVARADVAQLHNVLAQVQTQVQTASSVAQNRTTIINDLSRRTARAAHAAEAGDDPQDVGDALAQMAFQAGFTGLTTVLPWGQDPELVGFTVGDDRMLHANAVTDGVLDGWRTRAEALVDQVPLRSSFDVDAALGVCLLASPCYDETGRLIGSLAVVVEYQPALDAGLGDAALLNERVAEVENAAGAYGLMLTQLLGEG